MSWTMLPPAEDKCQQCAVQHDADQPHNPQSLFYQTKFLLENNRAATWLDAMAHCSPATQRRWTTELNGMGVNVEAGQIIPGGLRAKA